MKCHCPMQVTFVRSHFTEIVSGEENLGLPELPKDVIQSLLSSEELETQSEDDILEVVPGTLLTFLLLNFDGSAISDHLLMFFLRASCQGHFALTAVVPIAAGCPDLVGCRCQKQI